MGARRSRVGRKSLIDRFQQIPEAEELKEMLLGGASISETADILQNGWGHFRENTRNTIASMLYTYRKKLRDAGGELPPQEDNRRESLSRRAITKVVRRRYDKVIASIDKMIELEALYLVQRDRLEWLLEEEQKAGVPYANMSRDFVAATNTLLAHLKCESAVISVPEEEKIAAVSFDRYSENTAKALANPESRRRVVSILERIQRNARSVPGPCDAPVSCDSEVQMDVPGEPVTVLVEEN